MIVQTDTFVDYVKSLKGFSGVTGLLSGLMGVSDIDLVRFVWYRPGKCTLKGTFVRPDNHFQVPDCEHEKCFRVLELHKLKDGAWKKQDVKPGGFTYDFKDFDLDHKDNHVILVNKQDELNYCVLYNPEEDIDEEQMLRHYDAGLAS